MPECAQICLNEFYFTIPIVIPYLIPYHRPSSLSENLTSLQWLEVFDFVYCFRLNIFTRKI